MKKYYAADNHYASESSRGFGNTWFVMVFGSKPDRDKHVKNSKSIVCKAIKRSDIPLYCEAAKPFSGLKRVIDDRGYEGAPFLGLIGNDYDGIRI